MPEMTARVLALNTLGRPGMRIWICVPAMYLHAKLPQPCTPCVFGEIQPEPVKVSSAIQHMAAEL